MKKWHYWVGILGIMALLMTAGCGHPHQNQSLHGAYRIASKDADIDSQGNLQPAYWYFKKDGSVLWAQPETGDSDHGDYGDSGRGTWKSLGNNKYRVHIKYLYTNNSDTFTAKKTGNRLHTYENHDWSADDNYYQPQITFSDYQSMFKRARKSTLQMQQNDSSDNQDDNSTSSTTISNGNQALAYIKKQRGDHGFKLNGGTFGESDNPHASISDNDGNIYYVYANGTIKKQ